MIIRAAKVAADPDQPMEFIDLSNLLKFSLDATIGGPGHPELQTALTAATSVGAVGRAG